MSAIWVIAAKPLPKYRVSVSFSDGTAGGVDLEDFVFKDRRPIVAALRDPGVFAALRVELDTVVWANGFDLAPEFLYADKKVLRRIMTPRMVIHVSYRSECSFP